MTRRLLAAAFVLAACILAPSAALAADGDPDTAFGPAKDGFAYTPMNAEPYTQDAVASAVAPNGDVLTAVAFRESFSEEQRADSQPSGARVTRLAADGGNRTFGPLTVHTGDGATEPESPEGSSVFFAGGRSSVDGLMVLSDGRVVLLGRGDRPYVAHMSGDGKSVTFLPFNGFANADLRAVALAPDGTALGLWRADSGDEPVHKLERISPSGARTLVDFEPGIFPGAMTVGPTGRIVISNIEQIRAFNPDLTPVAGFGGEGGIAEIGFHPVQTRERLDPNDLVVGPSNEIFLALTGNNEGNWRALKLKADGSRDASFGTGGVADVDLAGAGVPDASRNVRRAFIQPDGTLYLIGVRNGERVIWGEMRRGIYDAAVLVRLTSAGAIDKTYAGGDGVFLVESTCPVLADIGVPVIQPDGKLLLPLAYGVDGGGEVPPCGQQTARAFAPAVTAQTVVARLANTVVRPKTPDPTPTPTPTPQTPQLIPPVTIEIPSKNVCGSARNFRIRLRTGRSGRERSPIVSAVVKVNGKRVKVNKGKRWTAFVNLKGLPKGRFTVSIAVKMADGGTAKETRRYRTCVPGMSFNFKRLVTHPPKKR